MSQETKSRFEVGEPIGHSPISFRVKHIENLLRNRRALWWIPTGWLRDVVYSAYYIGKTHGRVGYVKDDQLHKALGKNPPPPLNLKGDAR